MRRMALLLTGLALIATPAFSGEGEVRRSARRIPGRYIVALPPGADTATATNMVRDLKGARIRHTYERGLKGFALDMSDSDAQTLARDSRVQFVEEDATISIASTTWALDRIDQRLLPLDGSFVSNGSAAGVSIYVVDTGILAEHADFAGRVVPGFSAFADTRGTTDCNGHGTHVAGLAAGTHLGVAKSATLVPVRVLDCNGSGTVSTLLAGLDWVMEHHALTGTPAVVNMSIGGDPSSALDAAVRELIATGLTTVVAAGNHNVDACGTSPARVSAAITVGATTETDERASFSNHGNCVDLFAPGVNVLSSWYTSPTSTTVSSGTSASAPLVAGVAALTLEKYPTATPANVSQTILSLATADVVTLLGDGSPNRLLFSVIGALDETVSSDSQLLADPSFEYGTTFWSSDICTVVNPAGCGGRDIEGTGEYDYMPWSVESRSGNNHAAIGGPAKTFHLSSETVTIPATVQRAELSVYLWVMTKNKKRSAEDVLTVEIRDAAGVLLETVGSYSNLDAGPTWGLRRFDLTRFRGATIRIAFTGTQSQGPPTWFLLDDVGLNVWQ
ncbi:MAG TPA: S8 family peptidase [Thermoanaerobaculia bacterium]|nr:S8 family peptidase [Thermoanaerobaculia bacterium]